MRGSGYDPIGELVRTRFLALRIRGMLVDPVVLALLCAVLATLEIVCRYALFSEGSQDPMIVREPSFCFKDKPFSKAC